VGLAPEQASHFVLGIAAFSVLGDEHRLEDPAILRWNEDRHAAF
jgi:hypothetical protein